MRITAETAALLPQAFPQLASMSLSGCTMDTAAVLQALRTCPRLAHLTLDWPEDTDPEGLWAAAEAEAVAAYAGPDGAIAVAGTSPKYALLLDAVFKPWTNTEAEDEFLQEFVLAKEGGAKPTAAATGLLISLLPGLTSLRLSLSEVLSASYLVMLEGLGSRLTDLSLSDGFEGCEETDLGFMLTPALQACTCLTSLELALGISAGLPAALSACPGLSSLTKLSIPGDTVDQLLLDAILRTMPGEAAGVRDRRGIACLATARLPWR